jgi:Kef-type K+ transport system membrane component KefB
MELHFQYITLLFVLLVLPLALQRFRVPGAITSFLLGVICSVGFQLFTGDATIRLLSTFGIVSMFLFAGLEIDFSLLRRYGRTLILHLLLQFVLIAVISAVASLTLGLGNRASVVFAMALLTPSAGFILHSLHSTNLSESEQEQVKGIVLTNELATLILMFVVLQTTSIWRITLSASVLVALIVVLPIAFRTFAKWIAPYAPKSEFAFLILMAVISSAITRKLGVYYLLGAFIVGVTAQRFRKHIPSMTSENMLHAVEVFATLFIPFYFFYSGSHIQSSNLGWTAIFLGVALTMIVLPIRWMQITYYHHKVLGKEFDSSQRIGISLLPTLVFTLVLANLLQDRFHISSSIYGGLVIYAVIATIVPLLFQRTPLTTIDGDIVSNL